MTLSSVRNSSMTSQSSLESVHISVDDEHATIQCGGSTKVRVAIEVLHRSCLLSQALSDVADTSEVSVSMPVGVVGAWMDGMEAMQVDLQPQTRKRACKQSSKGLKRRKCCLNLADSLKAADFLDDQAALQGLCALAGQQLFAPFLLSKQEKVDDDLAGRLCELPSHLQQAVLATCKAVPVLLQLYALPPALQKLALHEAYPTIATSGCITIPGALLKCRHYENFLRVLGTLCSLQGLMINSCSEVAKLLRMLERVKILPGLTKLHILDSFSSQQSDSDPADSTVQHLLGSMKGLQDLSLSGSCNALLRAAAPALGQLKSVKHLDVSRCEVLPKSLFAQFDFQQLETFNMSKCIVQEHDMEVMAQYIGRSTRLAELRYSDISGVRSMYRDCWHGVESALNSLSASAPLQLLEVSLDVLEDVSAKSLACFRSLQVLRMDVDFSRENNAATDNAMKTFMQCISKLRDLRELQLLWCSPDEGCLQELACCLTTVTRLSKLVVSCWFRSDGAASLGVLVSKLPHLQELHVNQKGVLYGLYGSSCSKGSLLPCVANATNLKNLQIAQDHVSTKDTQALSMVGSRAAGLVTFKLDFESMGSAAAEALAAWLPSLSSLKHLHLCGSCKAKNAAACLVQYVGELRALQTLSIHHLRQCMPILAAQIPKLTGLQELQLHSTVDDLLGAEALAKHLSCLTALKVLKVQSSCIEDGGVLVLSAAVGNLSSLEELSIQGINMEKEDVIALARHLGKLVSLQKLNLSDICFSPAVSAALAAHFSTLANLRDVFIDESGEEVVVEDFERLSFQHCPYRPLHVKEYERDDDGFCWDD